MSLISQIRAYLETYYPQLIETDDENGDYYFEHHCSFKEYPSLVAVTVDKKIQTITLQIMIGKFFKDYESDSAVYEYINELNADYKFASFSEIKGALNLEYNLLVNKHEASVPPIIEHLLLIITAANDITGAEEFFDFELEENY